MPLTLRARPTCHYCGKRNKPLNNQSKFTCQYCLADNYLDESGQIDDVPALEAVSARKYATAMTPTFESQEGSIFCSTCLKNQYMYNSALAEYLPDPDHPEYDKFEAAIPAFKRDLERRFPTCCANCEPKVKAQLHQATYNARSDHVRRALDRSRQRRVANRWGWRSLLVNAAGLGWLVSLVIQLGWHALASQAYGEVVVSGMSPLECLSTWPVPVQCSAMAEQFVGGALLLGIVCIWWNPKWQHKLQGREGRLVGLDRFYKLQAVLLALRFASWAVCKDVPSLARFRTMIHAVSLALITMIAGWTRFNIVKVYAPRIVDWSQNPAPLLDSKQYVPPLAPQQTTPPNSQGELPLSVFETSVAPSIQPWRPPTPPTNDDAMEWAPTPASFTPTLKNTNYKSIEPSPFHGTLPAFSKGGIYKTKVQQHVEQPKAIGLPLGFFDKTHGRPLETKPSTMGRGRGLAQPKFFPADARADTGLENIFDKVFSLQDDAGISMGGPATVTDGSSNYSKTSGINQQTISLQAAFQQIFRCAMVVALAAGILLFDAKTRPSVVIYLAAFIASFNLFVGLATSLASGTSNMNASTIYMQLVESIWFLALSYLKPNSQTLLLSSWDSLITPSLCGLFFQEACQIYDSLSGYVAESQNEPHFEQSIPNPETVPSPPRHFVQLSRDSGHNSLRHSSSDESIASTASAATSSTISGWKTPVKNFREELRSSSTAVPFGLNGLSLQNADTFGVGSSIAGSRARQTPARTLRGAQR